MVKVERGWGAERVRVGLKRRGRDRRVVVRREGILMVGIGFVVR